LVKFLTIPEWMETVNEEGQTAIKIMVFGQTQHLISQINRNIFKSMVRRCCTAELLKQMGESKGQYTSENKRNFKYCLWCVSR
jgi:hypothetical protein